MGISPLNLMISRLGEERIPSPLRGEQFVREDDHVLYASDLRLIESDQQAGKKPLSFEMAGPRQRIYFDPFKLKCGIVTCGGLCPGLNDVIRSIVMGLYHA
jgi:6-phosphofructokinase 1